ncbi:RagB/SusD family nutrient uptake outer membrane protein [Aquimarina longa]|uniref:RagB/SusD family nutrient uptake outer membrane protein n=1 Tax=Aquimarina longa TaxID=1080221 RepID=UPI000A6A2A75|nr:RagB/SusD family nutrient uptake outer membrane protein [Aquimarina longa]
MKHNKIYINSIIIILIITLFSSCDDLLETEPNDTVSNDVALSDYKGNLAILIGGYNGFRNTNYYQRDFIVTADALADNIKQTINNTSRLDGIANNRPFNHFNFWSEAYKVIASSNFVISSVDNNVITDASAKDINQLKAEALFLRAFAHFDVLRSYARNPNHVVKEPLGIPIILQPYKTQEAIDYPPRETISKSYDQIILDLNTAFSIIEKNNTSNTKDRANHITIQALLSRVHLYAGNWRDCITASDYVTNNIDFSIETNNYTNIFSKKSETIFGLSYLSHENPGLNGSLEGLFHINEDGIGYGDFVARQNLYESIESGDIRKNLYISGTKVGESVNFIGKYLGYLGEFGLDNIPLIRLSEIILNRAEAKAENNDLSGALIDLNTIRNRAGITNITATTKENIIEATLKERRIELAFEGHRIFDLKRKGSDIPKGNTGLDCTSECSIPYTDFRVIANIPISEIDVNNNVKQNPGYQ